MQEVEFFGHCHAGMDGLIPLPSPSAAQIPRERIDK